MKNFLKEAGYSVIAHPRAGIHPLDLLSKEGDHLEAVESPLGVLFEPDVAPAPPVQNTASSISGSRVLEIDLKSNFSLLSGLFQKFGAAGGKVNLKAGISSGVKARFSFEKVFEEKISLPDLDNFLTGAIPLEGEFRTYQKRLQNSELYVITHVLKSSAFSIQFTDEVDRGVDVNAVLETTGEAGLSFGNRKDNRLTLESEGDIPLAFAFKAVQVLYDKAVWWDLWKTHEAGFRIKNVQGPTLLGEEDFPAQPLPPSDLPIDL